MKVAQVNIARMKDRIDSDLMSEFVNNLDRINSLAEDQKGFVWRLKDEENNATSIQVYEDEYIIINMSVWDSVDDLFHFVYNTAHAQFVKRGSGWFHRMEDMHMAIWKISPDHIPTAHEAKEKLEYLRVHGLSLIHI